MRAGATQRTHTPTGAPVEAGRRSVVAIALVTALVGASVLAYAVGKDCGAWEARERLRGKPRPPLCLSAP
jgi:hypothetical protein